MSDEQEKAPEQPLGERPEKYERTGPDVAELPELEPPPEDADTATKFSRLRRRRYLALVRAYGPLMSRHAAAVGMSYWGIHDVRRRDPEFERTFQEAVTYYVDRLHRLAQKRAEEGKSDRMLMAMLARHDPAWVARVRGEVKVTGKVGHEHGGEIDHRIDFSQLPREKRDLLRKVLMPDGDEKQPLGTGAGNGRAGGNGR